MTSDIMNDRSAARLADRGQTADRAKMRSPVKAGVLIAIVCLGAHGLSLVIGFSYDDFTWINLAKAWLTGHRGLFAPNPWNTFRPGSQAIISLEYSVFGLWAPGYHIVSLLLHVVSSLTVLAVVTRVTRSVRAGLIGALLFAGGIGHAEGADWISAIGFPAAGALAFGAILMADDYASNGRRRCLLGCGLLCVLALLMHEFAVLGLFGLAFYAACYWRERPKKRLWAVASTALVAGLLWGMLYGLFYLGQGQRIAERGEPSLLTTQRLVSNMSRAVPTLVLPDVHSAAIQHRLGDLAPRCLSGLVGASRFLTVGLALAFAVALLFGPPHVRFGVLWCAAGVALGCLSGAGFASRYLYLPMMGFVLAFSSFWDNRVLSSARVGIRAAGVATIVLLVLLNCLGNTAGLWYLRKNSVERQRLLLSIRSSSLSLGTRHPIVLSSWPEKYEDLVQAAELYGIAVRLDNGLAYPPGARYLVYSDHGARLVVR